jgi:hypothetical protein
MNYSRLTLLALLIAAPARAADYDYPVVGPSEERDFSGSPPAYRLSPAPVPAPLPAPSRPPVSGPEYEYELPVSEPLPYYAPRRPLLICSRIPGGPCVLF